MFDAFIAGDLFNLYVGFEILLVSSYVLITVRRHRAAHPRRHTYNRREPRLLDPVPRGGRRDLRGDRTVNMAQIAQRVAVLPEGVQVLLHVMLLTAFASRRRSSRCRLAARLVPDGHRAGHGVFAGC